MPSPYSARSIWYWLSTISIFVVLGISIWSLVRLHQLPSVDDCNIEIIIDANQSGGGVGVVECKESALLNERLNSISTRLDRLLHDNSLQHLMAQQDRCSLISGVFNISRYNTSDLIADYDDIIEFDNVRSPNINDATRTNITYFPAVPFAPPNGTGLGVNVPFLVGNKLDHTRFRVFQGIPFSVGFFFDVDYFTVDQNSRRLSVTQRNVGIAPQNIELRKVMSALTKNKIVCRYQDKVLAFVTAVYDSWVIHREPVLSSFQSHLIDYFIDIHLGDANPPDFVKQYFNDYLYFIATIDSNDDATIRTIRAHITNPCVRAYVESRIEIVIAQKLTDTITYHWIKSGMGIESAVTEMIYGIVSFGPLLNSVNSVVSQQINPALNLGTCGFSFLRLFTLASQGTAQLFNATCGQLTTPTYTGTPEQLEINVVREFLRITIPNPLSASTDTANNCAGCATHTQARHSFQLIEIRAEYDRLYPTQAQKDAAPWSPAFNSIGWNASQTAFGGYNPTKYAGVFNASYSDAVCDNNCSACLGINDTTQGTLNSINSFTVSTVDGETALPSGESSLIPVFETPRYAVFGLGAERNPYELLTQYTLLKLFDAIKALQFTNQCATTPNNCNFALIPLAPLRAARDSLFVL